MSSQGWALVGVGIGIVGTLCTTLVNNFLIRSSQRQQWIRDKKMQEYRELLTAMSKTEMLIIRNWINSTGEDRRDMDQAEIEAWTTIKDRIFVAVVINKENTRERWGHIIGKYHHRSAMGLSDFIDACSKLREDIMAAASKDFGIKEKYNEENNVDMLETPAKK